MKSTCKISLGSSAEQLLPARLRRRRVGLVMACAERSERREPKACCEISEGRSQAVLIGLSIVVSDPRD